jgi:hypothetical protein
LHDPEGGAVCARGENFKIATTPPPHGSCVRSATVRWDRTLFQHDIVRRFKDVGKSWRHSDLGINSEHVSDRTSLFGSLAVPSGNQIVLPGSDAANFDINTNDDVIRLLAAIAPLPSGPI